MYVAGRAGGQSVSIYWMDRAGKFQSLRATPGGYLNPAFSPDGKRLALDIFDGKRRDIWVYEWERDTLTRLTFAGEAHEFPVWAPDGQRIVYSSQQKGGTLTHAHVASSTWSCLLFFNGVFHNTFRESARARRLRSSHCR